MERRDIGPRTIDYELFRGDVAALFATKKDPTPPPEIQTLTPPPSNNGRLPLHSRPPRILGLSRRSTPTIAPFQLDKLPRIISSKPKDTLPPKRLAPIVPPRRLSLPKPNDAYIPPEQKRTIELQISDSLSLDGNTHVRAFYDEAEQTDQPWFYFNRAVLENLFVRYWFIHPEILQHIMRYAQTALQISLTHFVIAPTPLHLERLLLTFETAAGIGNEQGYALSNAEKDLLMAEEDIRRLLSLNDQDGRSVIQRIAGTLKIPEGMVSRETAIVVAVGRCNRAKLTFQRMWNRHARLRYDFLRRIADQANINIITDRVGRVELRLKQRALTTK